MFKIQIDKIKDEIYKIAQNCGRNPDEIKLLAVTKTHSAEVVKEALASGIRYIAENKVQEAENKIPQLTGLYQEFHFIGHLQSNKINKLLALNPTLIHSIDKFSTAEKMNQELKKLKQTQDILIEVNTSGEDSKNGITPAECSELIKRINELENIKIKGLMTIGALTEDSEKIRKCFQLLRDLFEKEKIKDSTKMQYLSMGMSNDFQIAISEGANIIRLGSIIFGTRQ